MKIPRILSPVTSFRGAVQVIAAGANELYCAVKIPGAMHLLNRPESCCLSSYGELGRIADYARSRGAETIVTLELPYVAEFMATQMEAHISSCLEQGIDALIVGDIGLIKIVSDMEPDVPIYASTLLGAMNYEAVGFLRELGVDRVILERHTTIEEMAEIVQRNVNVGVEVFVHGGGCSNINANCYLAGQARIPESALHEVMREIRGPVKPCRYPFDIYDLDAGVYDLANEAIPQRSFSDPPVRKLTRAPILDAFTFCSICQLPELIEVGVDTIKIVGRCRTLSYQVRTTRMYRDLLDSMEREWRRGSDPMESGGFHRMVEMFQNTTIESASRTSDSSPSTLKSMFCSEGRCYYSDLFHVPYMDSGGQEP